MFCIEIKRLYWIKETEDYPNDLCLHGDVVINLCNKRSEESCCASAAALYLLKAIEEDHIPKSGNQLFPCCGHFIIANEHLDKVEILGCNNGLDWSIIHKNDIVNFVTESNTAEHMHIEDYKTVVFNFADAIEKYYLNCTQKNIPQDKFEKDGYIAFWNEWHKRRLA